MNICLVKFHLICCCTSNAILKTKWCQFQDTDTVITRYQRDPKIFIYQFQNATTRSFLGMEDKKFSLFEKAIQTGNTTVFDGTGWIMHPIMSHNNKSLSFGKAYAIIIIIGKSKSETVVFENIDRESSHFPKHSNITLTFLWKKKRPAN